MQAISVYIFKLCGKHLDSEVAILNDIAFDTQEPTLPHQARSARRQTGIVKKLRPKSLSDC
jgi:hypothetical protein